MRKMLAVAAFTLATVGLSASAATAMPAPPLDGPGSTLQGKLATKERAPGPMAGQNQAVPPNPIVESDRSTIPNQAPVQGAAPGRAMSPEQEPLGQRLLPKGVSAFRNSPLSKTGLF